MREIGIVLIASFAIDRIVTGLFFLLSFVPELRPIVDPESIEDPAAKASAMRNYRVLYAIVAGYLATVVLAGQLGIRLSAITGLLPDAKSGEGWSSFLDILLTGLLLVGGADRLSEALKLAVGGDEKKSKTPIEITGKVVLEQGAAKTENGVFRQAV